MGRVYKKKVGNKREAEKEKQEEIVSKKKLKKEKPEPEPVGEEDEVTGEKDEGVDDEDDEEVDDEDDEEVDDEDDEEKNIMNFDFEAYPPSEDDRDGIINMLTQTFLRTDIDLKGMAEEIIAKTPNGIVLTQAYDDEETEEDFMTYGLCTTLALNEKKDDAPKYIKDVFSYLLNRAKKGAPSEIYKKIEEIQNSGDGTTGMFINERLLHFPADAVPQIFDSIRTDLAGFETKYKNIVYIQKLRIVENDSSSGAGEKAGNSSSSVPSKKKSKMGKAEKKRAAAAALASSEIDFDNQEDRVLFEIKEGKEVHFDFPVHMDVEPGSKFHSTEEDGKKWNPYRRLVIMDDKRFNAFLKKGSEGMIV